MQTVAGRPASADTLNDVLQFLRSFGDQQGITKLLEELAEKAVEFQKLEKEVLTKQSALEEGERAAVALKVELDAQKFAQDERAAALEERASALTKRTSSVQALERKLKEQVAQADKREAALNEAENALEVRVAEFEASMEKREADFSASKLAASELSSAALEQLKLMVEGLSRLQVVEG
jgi:septal ring factor EnvC (AmiA/AmiB activator)